MGAESVGLRFHGVCVVDFGAFSTKVHIVGERTSRCVVRTPLNVQQALLLTERDPTVLQRVLRAHLNTVATQCGLLFGTMRTVVALCNPLDRSPAVHTILVEWLRSVSCARLVTTVSPATSLVPFAIGASCAIVLDIGHGAMRAIPILHGVAAMDAAVVSRRGVQFCVNQLRQSILDDAQARQLAPNMDLTAVLTERVLLEYLWTFGEVSPSHSHKEWLHTPHPLPVKSVMLYGQPNAALEPLFYDDDPEVLTAPQCVKECWSRCHLYELRPKMECVVVVGGGAKFPNATLRVAAELGEEFPLGVATLLGEGEQDPALFGVSAVVEAVLDGRL